ncbi:MAG: hypothetical protein IPH44_25625 [Myxococcales bacterium]|nr:hypothetical protein [Myxococcales bacterium]
MVAARGRARLHAHRGLPRAVRRAQRAAAEGPRLFDGLRWLTLDQVLERYRDDDGDHGAADWPDAWVPLAGDATRTLVVDFGEAPAPVLLVDRDGVGEPLAATLRGYLTKVVADATAGRRQLVPGRGLVVV